MSIYGFLSMAMGGFLDVKANNTWRIAGVFLSRFLEVLVGDSFNLCVNIRFCALGRPLVDYQEEKKGLGGIWAHKNRIAATIYP